MYVHGLTLILGRVLTIFVDRFIYRAQHLRWWIGQLGRV